MTVACRKPASKIVSARLGPTDQKRLGQVSQFAIAEVPNPPVALSRIVGKYAALATPMEAFAWATERSAPAMSGRLSNRSDGIPTGIAPEQFVRKFAGTCSRGTILESQREQEKQVALALSKLGKLSDRNLFRILKPNFNFDENQKELLAEARIKIIVAAAAAAAQGKGAAKSKK